MPKMGLLFVFSEPSAAMEEELNEWYDREHIPERLAIEGFVSAVRYVSAVRPRRYLTLYDLAHVEVLDSANYKAFAGENFTPWTKRVVSRAKFNRMEATQTSPGDAPTAAASRLLVIRFSAEPGNGHAAADDIARCFSGKPGITQLRVFQGRGEQVSTWLAIVAGFGDLESLVDPQAFSASAVHPDLVETFLPL
jgi:hypothetical protein